MTTKGKEQFYAGVLDYAISRIGYKEISGNQGFEDKKFENELKQVEWQKGWAWCMSFVERSWIAPTLYEGKSKYFETIQRLITPSATKTLQNFKEDKSGMFIVDFNPEPGCIIIWQKIINGIPHWTGHGGICYTRNSNSVICIEGNTNSEGGREGIEVATMGGFNRHKLPAIKVQNGLEMKGCIKIA